MVTQWTSLPALKARWRKENKKNEKERNAIDRVYGHGVNMCARIRKDLRKDQEELYRDRRRC
jgi:hypothetical protein